MSAFTTTAIQLFFKPGMALMRRLRFPAKMMLMAVVLLVPLAWLTGQALLASHELLKATRLEARGNPLLPLSLDVVTQVQKHRGLVLRRLAGDSGVDNELVKTRADLSAAASALQLALIERPEFDLQGQWQPVRQVLDRLGKGEYPIDATQAFNLHSEQVIALRHLILRAAEDSGLLLDPEGSPFHLMHFSVEPLVSWTESLSQLRSKGADLVHKGDVGAEDRAEIVAQARVLSEELSSAEDIMAALQRTGEPLPAGFAAAVAGSRDFLKMALSTLVVGPVDGSAARSFDTSADPITPVVSVGKAAVNRLQTLLDERAEHLYSRWLAQLSVGIATVFGVAYLTAVFFRTSFGAIGALKRSVGLLAEGDFAFQVRLRGTDELSVVGTSLDTMTGQLSAMVADVRSNSSMVAQAGLSLASDTKALSERTEAQACSLEETTASVEDLSVAVRNSAQGAEAASGMAAQVQTMAEQGGNAIQSAVTAMQDIQSSSSRVQEIVGVIEGLSFQTNILALNAAVEAARAGEQGRGFAVVASEVRSLAQRSAESAREIKSLITASAQHVSTGVTQIGEASDTFAKIVQGIHDVASSVHEIKTSAAQQSNGLDQIAQAVRSIDEITQRNAQMVESAFKNSSLLSSRAKQLSAAVSNFKLRQGSADEALALVRKAVEMYKQTGTAALGQITDAASGLVDRDMYVFAFDRLGIYRAFAGKVEKIGTSVREVPGVDGDKLVKDAFERAAQGGGWVDYQFVNPQTGDVGMKTSYVEPVSPDLVIGCGVYKARDTSDSAPRRAAAGLDTAAAPKHKAPEALRPLATA